MIDPSNINPNKATSKALVPLNTGVATKVYCDLSTQLDPERFPHTRPLKNGSFRPKGTIENVEFMINSYGITAEYDATSE